METPSDHQVDIRPLCCWRSVQNVESRFSVGPKHAGKFANVVFHKNEYSTELKEGQNKIADTFTIMTVCRRFGSDVI